MAKASETVIAWTPAWWGGKPDTRGQVTLAPRPPYRAVDPFAMWAYATERGQSDAEQVGQVMIHFHTVVVRDGIDPQVAHAAFLGIDEYRSAISPDIKGAG